MTHPRILDSSTAALLVIDFQEAFRSVIGDFALIASRIPIAIRGFLAIGLPVLVTEQYPKGLGRTAEEILLTLPSDFEYLEKTAFSSYGARGLVEKLDPAGTKQVVVCGLETHVCVNQTAHDLLNQGLQVHVLADCVASRFEHDKQAGLSKMFASGAVPSSVEMALFELMRDSRHEKFKEIQGLIR